jgi:asparagine synthase (glutamine-hydrolysing)
MCGITGWIDYQKSIRQEEHTVKKMAETLSFRGPDDTNIWMQDHVGFGHKRLVVVDPQSAADDPKEERSSVYHLLQRGAL